VSIVTVRVDLPDPPEMFELLTAALGPVGETDVLSVTAPANPLLGSIVMMVTPEIEGLTLIKLELAVIVKSGVLTGVTVTATEALCESASLVPVMLTEYSPGVEELNVAIAIPEP
jgi:hypothetical protein